MSLFFVGKSKAAGHKSRIKEICNSFKSDKDIKELEQSSTNCFVYCSTPPKAIDDMFIELGGAGSWILLVGAPVLEVKTAEGKQKFAKEFFQDPCRVLRNQVDGHYAVLAYDEKNDEFFAGSDWNSLIPIYYAVTEEGPLFCGSELPLAKLLQSEIDAFGFAQAIQYGVVWAERTRFRDIRKLEACELIRIDAANNLKREKYWKPQMEELWKGSFMDVSQRWVEVMRKCIRVFSDQRGGSDLSSDLTGGEDSRLIAALLHDLDVPFNVRVAGEPNDLDVKITKNLANTLHLDLSIENTQPASTDELSMHASSIVTQSDGYHSFFTNALMFTHELHHQPKEYTNIHLCGLPGGPQFRGADYLRAKLLFPSTYGDFDYRGYTRRRFIMDYTNGLLKYSDKAYYEGAYSVIKEALEEVAEFPTGIQVDHLMRVRYGCLLTAHIKRPFYFAFAPRDMTRSTYNIPPSMKRGGKQYKAIIEMLWPELAWMKTQAGVPTVRKSLLRTPLFIPEQYIKLKKSFKGIVRQRFKLATALRAQGDVNARHHALAFHSNSIKWLFHTEPYSVWFKSADTMMSGNQYSPLKLNELLSRAKQPDFDQVQLFGRVVSQELAFRKVYGLI